jgi:hypothetical protein
LREALPALLEDGDGDNAADVLLVDIGPGDRCRLNAVTVIEFAGD